MSTQTATSNNQISNESLERNSIQGLSSNGSSMYLVFLIFSYDLELTEIIKSQRLRTKLRLSHNLIKDFIYVWVELIIFNFYLMMQKGNSNFVSILINTRR